jgi:hypothetical protein
VNPANVLYVRTILLDPANPSTGFDPLRIKLARTYAEATALESSLLKAFAAAAVNSGTDTITLAGHGFANGQSVTYRADKVFNFFTESVDVNLRDVDVDGVTRKDIQRNDAGVGLHNPDADNIFLENHGLVSGDALTYRNTGTGPDIGGLSSGTTYYVIRVDAHQIRLAATYWNAVGRPYDNNGTTEGENATDDDIQAVPIQHISLSTPGKQEDTHRLEKNIKGLQDGRTYYVHRIDAYSFRLMTNRTDALANSSPVDIGITDQFTLFRNNGAAVVFTLTTRTGTHFVGTTGIDLRAGTNTQSLRIDLTPQASGATQPTGEHRLLGPGGASLNSILPPPGDGLSGVRAVGGSGGGVDVSVPSAKITATFTVKAYISATSVTAGGSVSILANSASGVSSYADTAGGGVVAIGEARADAWVTSAPTEAYVGTNTRIVAGNDVLVRASSDHDASATARSAGGGAISGKIARTKTELTFSDKAYTQAGANITAGDALAIRTSSAATGKTDSETYSVGLGAGADSDDTNGNRGVDINLTNAVTIGAGTTLFANSIDLEASVDRIFGNARAKSTAYSPIFFGVATAFSRAKVDVDTNVTVDVLGSSTRITGIRGVDIQARQAGITIVRDASQLAVALIPPQNSFREGTLSLNSTVNTPANMVVTAGARDVSRAGEDLAAGKSGLRDNSALGQATALYAGAAVTAPSVNAGPAATPAGEIRWDADVVILGGLEGAPELVIDASGNVVRANAVKIGGVTPVIGTAATSGNTISVDAITNDGNGGILFYAENVIKNVATSSTAGWPLFDFQAALAGVSIIDASGKILQINGIDVISSADLTPLVRLVTAADQVDPVNPGTPYTLEFDLQRNAGTTLVDIQKRGANNLVLNGTINNPTGWTHILNTERDILSSNAAGWIFTNVLDIEATQGKIGTATARINVGLIQGLDRGDTRIASDDKVRTTRLYGNAQQDVFLRLKAYDRVPDGHPLRPASFIAYVDRVSSTNGSVDLLLEDSVRQAVASGPGNVQVQVRDKVSTETYDRPHSRHFLPDGTPLSLDTAAYPGAGTPIDSLYRFEQRQARPGGSLLNYAGTTVEYRGFDPAALAVLGAPVSFGGNGATGLLAGDDIIVKDVQGAADNTINGAAGVATPRIMILGFTDLLDIGQINVNVDGSVDLTENAGDLRVGLVRSRAGDVTLTSLDASIVDAASGNGAVPAGDAAADVVGINITLLATKGGIGSAANFLEIDSSNLDGAVSNGVLDAQALNGIYITEVNGDLRLKLVDSDVGDVSLVTLAGSIIDGRVGAGLVTDAAVIFANSIDLQAIGGSIGKAGGDGNDLEIDSSRYADGSVGLEASNDIYLTEVSGTLRLVQARTPLGSQAPSAAATSG